MHCYRQTLLKRESLRISIQANGLHTEGVLGNSRQINDMPVLESSKLTTQEHNDRHDIDRTFWQGTGG
ncbi:hypothetical protein [Pricia sp.]|uniref:hypothetical protein n=1 Tax=Pricia sp. TaxID=2268138 RepID=UPI003594932A